MSQSDPSCLTCQNVRGLIRLSPGPRIVETDHWLVEHAHPTRVRGWLVLVLRRHAAALHELTAEEAAGLGRLLPLLCRALHETLGAEKEYVMQFAEGPGFHHVHIHVVARLPEWPADLRGPDVFNGLGEGVERPLGAAEMTALCLALAAGVAGLG